jgi:serine/threonine protein kinase
MYTYGHVLGKGMFGVVYDGIHIASQNRVAIKRISLKCNNEAIVRIVREVKFLMFLRHVNITGLREMTMPMENVVDLVMDRMDADLYTVIHTCTLTSIQRTYILYQILCGLEHMHLSGVVHRDLKPQNILINKDIHVKVADLGIARSVSKRNMRIMYTGYVTTRWYRAPELCGCFFGSYDTSIDIWAVGCIFAEMLLKAPLFPGNDSLDQIKRIVEIMGSPRDEVVDNMINIPAKAFLKCIPKTQGNRLEGILTMATAYELDLIKKLLIIEPRARLSCSQALDHELFTIFNNVNRSKVPSLIPRDDILRSFYS